MEEISDKQQIIKNPPHRFKPGQSGNPAGRPKKGSAWADIRNEILSAKKIKLELTVLVLDKNPESPTFGKQIYKTKKTDLSVKNKKGFRFAILTRQLEKALEGDLGAQTDFMDREDGTPVQSVNLGGQPDNQLPESELNKILASALTVLLKEKTDNV
jgi:hypothetical protein